MSEKQINQMMGNIVAHQSAFKPLLTSRKQWVLENPKKAIELFVDGVDKYFDDQCGFSITRDIERGGYNFSPVELLAFIKTSGCILLSQLAEDLFSKMIFQIPSEKTIVKVVFATAYELGASQSTYPEFTRQNIYNYAKKMGLKTVPIDLALNILEQCKVSPIGDSLIVAVDPISYKDEHYMCHLNYHGGTRSLGVCDGAWNGTWSNDAIWVFAIS